jgi:hypothetical protein
MISCASIGRVAAQDQSILLGCEGVGEPFSGGANVNVLLHEIAEVLLADARRLRVKQQRVDRMHRDRFELPDGTAQAHILRLQRREDAECYGLSGGHCTVTRWLGTEGSRIAFAYG